MTKELALQKLNVSVRALLMVHNLVQQWLQNSGVEDKIFEHIQANEKIRLMKTLPDIFIMY